MQNKYINNIMTEASDIFENNYQNEAASALLGLGVGAGIITLAAVLYNRHDKKVNGRILSGGWLSEFKDQWYRVSKLYDRHKITFETSQEVLDLISDMTKDIYQSINELKEVDRYLYNMNDAADFYRNQKRLEQKYYAVFLKYKAVMDKHAKTLTGISQDGAPAPHNVLYVELTRFIETLDNIPDRSLVYYMSIPWFLIEIERLNRDIERLQTEEQTYAIRSEICRLRKEREDLKNYVYNTYRTGFGDYPMHTFDPIQRIFSYIKIVPTA